MSNKLEKKGKEAVGALYEALSGPVGTEEERDIVAKL
jgi:hypothetical protein